MNESLLHTVERLARQSVQDVFVGMLSLPLSEQSPLPPPSAPPCQIAGSVGFVGDVNGIIHLYTSENFARLITSRLLGLDTPDATPDEMVNDAMGELGNVVVGNVKSRLCDAGHACTLTLPSIMRGEQLCRGDMPATESRTLGYVQGDHHLSVEIVLPEGCGGASRQPARLPPRILTVDDSKLVRLRVGKALGPCDCVLLEAANGEEALDVARNHQPDLILLDYTMPVMDGLETVTALRADPALESIPVIMLTAEGSRKTMVQMASLGVRDYLLKPFQESVLLERVQRVLGALSVPVGRRELN